MGVGVGRDDENLFFSLLAALGKGKSVGGGGFDSCYVTRQCSVLCDSAIDIDM